jgi:hypothetical protein
MHTTHIHRLVTITLLYLQTGEVPSQAVVHRKGLCAHCSMSASSIMDMTHTVDRAAGQLTPISPANKGTPVTSLLLYRPVSQAAAYSTDKATTNRPAATTQL